MPAASDPPVDVLHGLVLSWYATAARDLPWRRPEAGPWAVLVSEVMLQQTPVARVLPVYEAWLQRWPTPAALAAEPAGLAIRAWGRLGYPRRALRLHAAAVAMVERHDGCVPDRLDALRALPGVGEYTAAAVASFAFGQRHAVLDTNVRRLLARAVFGSAQAAPGITAAERGLAAALVPDEADRAARWAVAVMELGALVCSARSPRCGSCPLRGECVWRRAGSPPGAGSRRRAPSYEGSDREARGRLLAAVRGAVEPLAVASLLAVWPDAPQGQRALASLVADGLLVRLRGGRYDLQR